MILALAAACTLSAPNRAVVERTFAAWSHVSRDLLQLPKYQPPLIILVDRRCTYTFRPSSTGRFSLEGTRVGMTTATHGDSVLLPTGAKLPIAGMAFTSLYGSDDKAYFYATLPDVWKADPKYRDDPEDWATFLTPVMLHELTHTRQLLAIMKSLEPAGKALKLSNMDDDMIQLRFQSDTAFTSSVLRERDLLLEAALERDTTRRLTAVRQSLDLRRARYARFFTGADSAFAAIETRFIDMEWRSGQRTGTCASTRTPAKLPPPFSIASATTRSGGRRSTAWRCTWRSMPRCQAGSTRSSRHPCARRSSCSARPLVVGSRKKLQRQQPQIDADDRMKGYRGSTSATPLSIAKANNSALQLLQPF